MFVVGSSFLCYPMAQYLEYYPVRVNFCIQFTFLIRCWPFVNTLELYRSMIPPQDTVCVPVMHQTLALGVLFRTLRPTYREPISPWPTDYRIGMFASTLRTLHYRVIQGSSLGYHVSLTTEETRFEYVYMQVLQCTEIPNLKALNGLKKESDSQTYFCKKKYWKKKQVWEVLFPLNYPLQMCPYPIWTVCSHITELRPA